MSLEKILQALEVEAEDEMGKIEQATQSEVDQIQAEAEKKAATIKRKYQAEVKQRLKLEQARQLNQARLEALRTELGTREELIISALDAAAERLAGLSGSKSYASLLQCLLQEAIETLNADGDLQIQVLEQDVEVVEGIIEQMELAAIVCGLTEEQLKISSRGPLGGLVALASDGHIRLTNTLEARLQRVAGLYRAQIAESLLDQTPEA